MDWDPEFSARSLVFEPLRGCAAPLRAHRDWPGREALQSLLDARNTSNAAGTRLRLIGATHEPYEEGIRLRGEMPSRERSWHDLFNTLAWLAYPQTKAALNEAHCAAFDGGATRGPRRDALTVFDESGAIVLSSDESLLDDLHDFRWKRLFVERREEMKAAMRVLVLGHALFEKALRPYVGMTAHALLLPVSAEVIALAPEERVAIADRMAARALDSLTSTRSLAPLPVLGVPGWWSDNEDAAFYDNAAYFRAGRGKSQ